MKRNKLKKEIKKENGKWKMENKKIKIIIMEKIENMNGLPSIIILIIIN